MRQLFDSWKALKQSTSEKGNAKRVKHQLTSLCSVIPLIIYFRVVVKHFEVNCSCTRSVLLSRVSVMFTIVPLCIYNLCTCCWLTSSLKYLNILRTEKLFFWKFMNLRIESQQMKCNRWVTRASAWRRCVTLRGLTIVTYIAHSIVFPWTAYPHSTVISSNNIIELKQFNLPVERVSAFCVERKPTLCHTRMETNCRSQNIVVSRLIDEFERFGDRSKKWQ